MNNHAAEKSCSAATDVVAMYHKDLKILGIFKVKIELKLEAISLFDDTMVILLMIVYHPENTLVSAY